MDENILIDQFIIPTYIINLIKRTDRKENVMKEFSGRDEFEIRFVEPEFHDNPAQSLRNTIAHILRNGIINNDELILICEDDHQFTTHYSRELLFKCIAEARIKNCDLLSGGVSCARSTFQLTDELYWMEGFTGLQFTIIFNKIFQQIIDFKFSFGNDVDIVISSIADNKLLMYPFISTQKEFGYSDVTAMNNVKGRLDSLFTKSSARIENLRHVASYYDKLKIVDDEIISGENIFLPTYVILHKAKNNCLDSLKNQFENRGEFVVSMTKTVANGKDNSAYISAIIDIVTCAIKNKDDVIVICEDDHKFTKYYSKDLFMRNILEAHTQGASLLLGDIADFDSAVSITNDRFWVNSFTHSKFMVVFKNMYEKILAESFEERKMKDHVLSELTSHKMVVFPFISTHEDSESFTSQKLMRIKKAHQSLKPLN